MSQTAYYRTILETPFGQMAVVVKAGFPEEAKLLTHLYDGRQIGYRGAKDGVYSPIVEGPKRTTKKATEGMQRHNDPYNEIWAKAL